MRDMAQLLEHLKSVGFNPQTVIDVGVAYGTPPLYAAFPSAYFVLCEPIAEFEKYLKSHLNHLKGEYHLCAVSEVDGTAQIYVSDQADGSSLMHQDVKSDNPALRTIETKMLDTILGGRKMAGPILLKTDCQGGDLKVMAGAKKLLTEVDVIIMEVGMFHFWGKATPDFADTVIEMKRLGFVPYELFDLMQRPSDGALGQLDIVFVKDDGPFRISHKW